MRELDTNRMFIQGTAFLQMWASLGFSDEDLRHLEKMLLENPKLGDVIRGTGRMRKIRFPLPNQGKRGSVRVCYVDFEEKGILYLLAVFSKNEQENLSASERNSLKKQIDLLDATLKGGGSS